MIVLAAAIALVYLLLLFVFELNISAMMGMTMIVGLVLLVMPVLFAATRR